MITYIHKISNTSAEKHEHQVLCGRHFDIWHPQTSNEKRKLFDNISNFDGRLIVDIQINVQRKRPLEKRNS